MTIRPTTEADVSGLLALTAATEMFKPLEIETLEEVFADYFAAMQEAGHVAETLELDGEMLGFIYYAPAPMTEGTWELWWIVVRRDQQGRGLGRKLLLHVEQAIRDLGGRVLFIETGSVDHYEPTRQFYLKNGYELEATLRDYYAAGDSKVVFRRDLNEKSAGLANPALEN